MYAKLCRWSKVTENDYYMWCRFKDDGAQFGAEIYDPFKGR